MLPDQKVSASGTAGEHFTWVIDQIDGLAEKFRPFLTLNKRSRSPLHFFFLNMRQGILRIWIVASVIWVLLVGINGWAEMSEIFVGIEPAAGKGAITLSPGPYACWVARNPDNPFNFMKDDYSGPRSLPEAWRQCAAFKMRIPINALGPPLILLVLGYVGAWVMKGFRTT